MALTMLAKRRPERYSEVRRLYLSKADEVFELKQELEATRRELSRERARSAALLMATVQRSGNRGPRRLPKCPRKG